MSTQGLEQAFDVARGVLANVKAEQMDDATPCQSWKVKDLVNHMVSGSQWFGRTMDAGKSSEDGLDADFSSQDYNQLFDEAAKNSVRAFSQDGAMEKQVTLPFGQFPGIGFMGLATTDVFTHAWDLAKATGQDTNLNPQLANELLGAAKANIADQFRGEDGKMPFGPEQQAPEGASNADQLAAFLGRKV
ncbi:MAG: TIGR03086 family protein [Actinobacteria bacterium]|nr:TIGR03086 family protein [Actinomycetota bacterium]